MTTIKNKVFRARNVVLAAVGALVITAGLAVGGLAMAADAVGGPGCLFGCSKMAGQHLDRISAELDLNDEQRGYLENVRELLTEKHEQRATEHAEKHERILEAIEQGDVDAEVVHQAIDEHMAEAQTTVHQVADELVAFVNSLDEDQRAELVERMETFHAHMEKAMNDEDCAGKGPHCRFRKLHGHGDK